MRQRLVFLNFLVLACLPTVSTAQQFEVTPIFGFAATEVADDNDQSPRSLAREVDIDDQPTAGLILGVGITRRSQIELLVSRQDSRVENLLFNQNQRDLELEHRHIGYLYQWPLRRIEPFVVGSVGTTQATVGARSEEAFSLSVGGGLKVRANDRFGFRLASRLFVAGIDEDGPILCPLDHCLGHGGEEGLVQLDLRAGLFVRF
jgi:hypothetical protein